MKSATFRHATLSAALVLAATASPALARWQWVEDEPGTVVQEYQEPRGPGYYQQQETRTEYREVEREPVATSSEVFHDGGCEVTRTYLSDGSWNDDRVCSEYHIVPPHVFIIDRIGRHFDRLRAHNDAWYGH